MMYNKIFYRPYQQMCLQTFGRPRDIKDYVEELLKFEGKWKMYEQLKKWEVPKFPVDGNMLKQKGCPQGRVIGNIMNELKKVWIKNEFKSTSDEILEHLPKVLEELNIVDGKPIKKPKLLVV